MQNDSTLQNKTYTGCWPDRETLAAIELSIYSVSSVLSFVGNLAVILTVYKNKELRTAPNCFIVNMSVSDVVFPLFYLLQFLFRFKKLGHVSQFAGNMLCKLLPIFFQVSCGVSMLSLIVITIHRFSAVMFPMNARVQNKRKLILVLALTWAIPIAVTSPFWVYRGFSAERQRCSNTLTFNQVRIWYTVALSLVFFLPLLIMLVLYPVILVKLRQHKVPGNANRPQAVIRRRKQNLRLTVMFIVISTAFFFTWGPHIVFYLISFYLPTFWIKMFQQHCAVYYVFVSTFFPPVFQAINPMIYFIFCSSFRKGLKQTFSCCCAAGDEQLPAANNIQLNIIPQA